MKKIIIPALATILLGLQVKAQSPTAPAQGFNVFVANGATLSTNETEGPVAIGGDLTIAGSYQVSTNYTGTFTVSGVKVTLLVGGKVNYSSGNGVQVNQNGYVKIGTANGCKVWYTDQNNAYSPIRITPGVDYNGSPRIMLQANAQNLGVNANTNPVIQGGLIDFAAAFTTMKNTSTSISACTDNATLTNPNGNPIAHTGLPTQVKITLNTGTNVLNLTGADMNNVQNFTFNNSPDATHILIINVNAPGTFNWSAWTNGGIGFSNCPYVLYNFYNTTTLNIQGYGAVEGTVFAPYADVVKTVNQANIEGQVIGQSYNHSGGETHYAVFSPSVTGCGTSDATWTCNSSNDWFTASNWSPQVVPTATTNVIIPSNTPCQPKITSGTAYAKNINIYNGAIVTINTGAVLNVKGNLTLTGTVTGGGYITLNGTTAQTISGNGKADNFELNNSTGATISSDTLHIKKTYKPTLGTLTTNNKLELCSDTTATAAILSSTNCSYISGNVIADKWIHGGKRAFRFLAHPFSSSIPLNQLRTYIDITGTGGATNGFDPTATNNPSSFWYNTATGNGDPVSDPGWTAFTNTNGAGVNSWDKGEGALVMVRGAKGEGICCNNYNPSPVVIKMYGPLNQCNVALTCATNANQGYNFMGNPYASNVDLKLTTRGSAIGANFSVWDPNQGTNGAYVQQPFSISYVLPAYAGFIVNCSSTTNNTITFHETDKTSSNATGNLFKATGNMGNDVLQLRILSDNNSISWDRLLVMFNQGAATYDVLDAEKLSNDLDFFTFSEDSTKLAVDARPYVDGEVIKIGLRTDMERSYSIIAEDYNINPGVQLFLMDNYLGTVTPITQGMQYDFTVTSDPASAGNNRFAINENGIPSTTGITSTGAATVRAGISPNPTTGDVTVNYSALQKGNTTIRVVNMMGQDVYTALLGESQAGQVSIPSKEFAAGIYIVSVKCGNQVTTQKLIKK